MLSLPSLAPITLSSYKLLEEPLQLYEIAIGNTFSALKTVFHKSPFYALMSDLQIFLSKDLDFNLKLQFNGQQDIKTLDTRRYHTLYIALFYI